MLTPETGVAIARDAADEAPAAVNEEGAGVAEDVDAGNGAAATLPDAGRVGGSGGGVKMPKRCLASRSFSNLAALAAALSC